jgi:hypothetical protein
LVLLFPHIHDHNALPILAAVSTLIMIVYTGWFDVQIGWCH